MTWSRRMAGIKKFAAVALTAALLQFGSCDFGTIDLSNVVAVDGRQAIETLLVAAVVGSLEGYVRTGVDGFLDFFDPDDDSAD